MSGSCPNDSRRCLPWRRTASLGQRGWAQRWGLPNDSTGIGDTPEQVAAFRVAREELLGYLDAAHPATVERAVKLTSQQLEQPIEDLPGDNHPAWQALRRMCSDSLQHLGQINYIRGLMSGYGWSQMP